MRRLLTGREEEDDDEEEEEPSATMSKGAAVRQGRLQACADLDDFIVPDGEGEQVGGKRTKAGIKYRPPAIPPAEVPTGAGPAAGVATVIAAAAPGIGLATPAGVATGSADEDEGEDEDEDEDEDAPLRQRKRRRKRATAAKPAPPPLSSAQLNTSVDAASHTIAPPSAAPPLGFAFTEGEQAEVLCGTGSEGEWRRGRIDNVDEDDATFDIAFEDGAYEESVAVARIRRC